MRLPPTVGQKVHHHASPDGEGVRDHPAMASPPYGLCAHDGGRPVAPSIDQPLERGSELGRLHVIGVPSEARRGQSGVGGVGPRLPPAPEILSPDVLDAVVSKRLRQSLLAELGMSPRSGSRSNVHQPANPGALEQRDHARHRSGPVADGEDDGPRRILGLLRPSADHRSSLASGPGAWPPCTLAGHPHLKSRGSLHGEGHPVGH